MMDPTKSRDAAGLLKRGLLALRVAGLVQRDRARAAKGLRVLAAVALQPGGAPGEAKGAGRHLQRRLLFSSPSKTGTVKTGTTKTGTAESGAARIGAVEIGAAAVPTA